MEVKVKAKLIVDFHHSDAIYYQIKYKTPKQFLYKRMGSLNIYYNNHDSLADWQKLATERLKNLTEDEIVEMITTYVKENFIRIKRFKTNDEEFNKVLSEFSNIKLTIKIED